MESCYPVSRNQAGKLTAGSSTGALRGCLLGGANEVVAHERHEHEHSDQAVDDRRDRREQTDHRHGHAPQARGGELHDEDRAEQRQRYAEQQREGGAEQRPVDDRPCPDVEGRGRGVHARPDHALYLAVHVTARTQPGQALVRERRPRPGRDERDHRDHAEARQERRRAEHALGPAVAPRLRQTPQRPERSSCRRLAGGGWGSRRPKGGHYLIGCHCVEMI